MRIVSIDTMQVPSGNTDPSRGGWNPVVIRINTDEGISGFGEAGLAYGKAWRGGFGLIQSTNCWAVKLMIIYGSMQASYNSTGGNTLPTHG